DYVRTYTGMACMEAQRGCAKSRERNPQAGGSAGKRRCLAAVRAGDLSAHDCARSRGLSIGFAPLIAPAMCRRFVTARLGPSKLSRGFNLDRGRQPQTEGQGAREGWRSFLICNAPAHSWIWKCFPGKQRSGARFGVIDDGG